MFILLFLALSTSAQAEGTAPMPLSFCPIDPEYSCCQDCTAREWVCKNKNPDLTLAMTCSQSKKECEKKCEKKLGKKVDLSDKKHTK